MHRIDRRAIGSTKGDVQLSRLGASSRAEPEAGDTIRTGQTHDDAVTLREAHRLAHPDRGEHPQVEGERGVDVSHLHAEMIEHAQTLLAGPSGRRA